MELAVTIAVMGILASIALPQFLKYSQTARRADAQVALNLQVQNLERCRVKRASYIGCSISADESPDEHYRLRLTNVTRSSYNLIANAQGAQAKDTECSFLAIDSEGVRAASSNVERCWSN